MSQGYCKICDFTPAEQLKEKKCINFAEVRNLFHDGSVVRAYETSMPHYHKRRAGSRRYKDLSKKILMLHSSLSKKVCPEKMLKKYLVSLKRLGKKIKWSSKQSWATFSFTMEEEKVVVDRIQSLCRWSFPLDGSDLRYLIYL